MVEVMASGEGAGAGVGLSSHAMAMPAGTTAATNIATLKACKNFLIIFSPGQIRRHSLDHSPYACIPASGVAGAFWIVITGAYSLMGMTDAIRTAACPCGKLAVTVTGEPVRISMCHCLDCQRRSGSVFAAQARWPRERVAIKGRSNEYVRTGDEGRKARFHFCPNCGSTVWYTIDVMPDVIAIPIGAFADPNFPVPTYSVFENRRHAWVSVPEGAERD